MVGHELVIVLAGLFESQEKNNELLTLVRCLHEIVGLEFWFHIPVWIVYEA